MLTMIVTTVTTLFVLPEAGVQGGSMDAKVSNSRSNALHYDRVRRRLWVLGQRCHHGATGAILTTVGTVGIVLGGVLMAHDWKDREMWFERGWGNQP
ncbi:MAG: hypothetical protein JHC84_06035 [Solirubrobacteraceae bacterium]|nr:hypothetical protein [Solirubrobacteraceae bacterium]